MASRQVDEARDCIETVRHTKIKVTDPGTARVAILFNPNQERIRRIKMDNCLAPAGQVSADWIVSNPRVVDVIVELKGKNVDHAVEQIEATRVFWSRHDEYIQGQVIGAWIICTEYPRASTKVARYRERFRAQGLIMIISTHNGEERNFADFLPRRP